MMMMMFSGAMWPMRSPALMGLMQRVSVLLRRQTHPLASYEEKCARQEHTKASKKGTVPLKLSKKLFALLLD